MRSLNQVTLVGNVTKNPELKYILNGQAVIKFSVVTNREWKNAAGEKQEAVEFTNVVFWGKAAEIINQFITKGKKILVQGRLQTRTWTSEDGVKHYMTEVIGQDFLLLSPKDESTKEVGVIPAGDEGTGMIDGKPEEKVNPDDIPF